MRLTRDGVLVAHGKATREPDGDVVLFEVTRWHVDSVDASALAEWRTGGRPYVQSRAGQVGLGADGSLRTIHVPCFGVTLDVRDA